MVYAPYLPPLT
jgi:CTD small phosphatase-like protein 2